jgi:hypothetical protein
MAAENSRPYFPAASEYVNPFVPILNALKSYDEILHNDYLPQQT